MSNTQYRSVFATFDPYPSYKGSAIHIDKVTEVLSQKFPSALLLSLGRHMSKELPETVHHLESPIEESNYLKRALAFSAWVDGILTQQHNLQIGHFRDIWSGLPILARQHITSIFEVNGLPSIELVSRYPYMGQGTLNKIRKLEDECLEKSQLIICPSETIKRHLVSRSVWEEKIHVIPNGADIPVINAKPKGLPEQYIVYFGALQPWQGVDTLLKAMKYLGDKPGLKLVICSSHKPRFARPFQKLAEKLAVSRRVIWKYQLGKEELHQIISYALCTVAPLTECSRNLEQGCSPLKVFESMACKTPVIASDLPVIREILEPDTEAKFFRPERPADLARCVRLLMDYPELRSEIAENAFVKFKEKYTWERINRKLSSTYYNIFNLVC
ncbi:glycosyltransferase family 4 protein [Fulvivirga sp. 29W222]|uniref:Glycosyltransferase family 4 protein n=1 Tax=Fulvivirga marina TaxID=2494733 RepID=A0A937G0E6_9BACT|nr:glycosyltransferase family 4 protein [Fulvivirga marina]MBL6449399.1 glycosyltransferase family 4 protein [Fulvivirga marina]